MTQRLSLAIQTRDPIVARDGRPFGIASGRRMRSTGWIYPTVLAGSLRTLLGKLSGGTFTREEREQLKAIEIAGPFPECDEEVYLPAPKDAVFTETAAGLQPRGLRPWPIADGKGGVFPPLKGPSPVALVRDSAFGTSKSADPPAFWSLTQVVRWLCDPTGASFGEESGWKDGLLRDPLDDERVHVQIDPDSGAHRLEDGAGMLFSTVGLCLEQLIPPVGSQASLPIRLVVRIDADEPWSTRLENLHHLHPLGGERRLAYWSRAHKDWKCPAQVTKAMEDKPKRIRMALASPGLFDGGWRPGWLNEEGGVLKGAPPGFEGVLRLEGAVVPRWLPISGFSLEKPRGPKPVRWMVPAGSVYFFTLERGSSSELAQRFWLKSVSDQTQDRRDGFSLAAWGVWDQQQET